MSESRVFVVWPGDTILIGRVGPGVCDPDSGAAEALADVFDRLDVRVVVFEGDIDVQLVPGGGA